MSRMTFEHFVPLNIAILTVNNRRTLQDDTTLQSRALAGLANKTLIVAMPGSPKACDIAWDEIISAQLDARQGPCNFVPQLKASDGVMCPSREKDACN